MRTSDLQIHPLIDNQKIELIVDKQAIINDEYDDLLLHKYDCANNRYDVKIPLNGGEPLIESRKGNEIPMEIIKEIRKVCNQDSLRRTLIDINVVIRNQTNALDNNTLFPNAIEQIAKTFGLEELIHSDSGKTYTANLYKLENRLFYLTFNKRGRHIVVGENVLKLTLFKKDSCGNYYYIHRRNHQ